MRIFLNHFFFIIICVNLFFLSLYENKLVYEFYHLKQIFYDQKDDNDIFLISYVPSLCFLLWILLILRLSNFFNTIF